jgi:uncharacterized protein YggE
MATVTVRGEAVVPGVADAALVSLALEATRDRPESAYDDVAARSESLHLLLDELEIERARRSTAGVSVQEQFEHDAHGRREHRGYRASARMSVRVDPPLVSRLLREAVARAEASVEGPYWRLAGDNAARTEARRLAALDARRRAETYAEALGMRLGAIVSVTEPGTAVPLAMGGFQVAHEIEVDAGELDVRGAVEVTFALEPA